MCPDTVDREGRREWIGSGLGGLPWARRVPRGSPHPRRSAPRFASSPEARGPWAEALGLGMQSVTHVPGQNCHPCARLHRGGLLSLPVQQRFPVWFLALPNKF